MGKFHSLKELNTIYDVCWGNETLLPHQVYLEGTWKSSTPSSSTHACFFLLWLLVVLLHFVILASIFNILHTHAHFLVAFFMVLLLLLLLFLHKYFCRQRRRRR